jgi:DNA-directed RNA polymerase specialized sigma24 family protein
MSDVTELLAKAAAGDRQAQADLYRLTEPELRKLALHWIRRWSAKERVRTTEVIDGAFVKLMQIASPGWQHRGVFYAFASRNVFRVLIDLLRRNTGPPGAVGPDEVAARPRGLTQHSLFTLHQALQGLEQDLSERHRVIVELRFLGECTLDEIAGLLSTSEEVLSRDRVFRMCKVALAYLREKLGPSFPEFGRPARDATGGEECPP